MKKAGGLEEAFKRQKDAGDMASKMLAMEAEMRKIRGEFSEFRRESRVELSRLNEFEDRMDFLDTQVSNEDDDDASMADGREKAQSSGWSVGDLMTGRAEGRSSSSGAKARRSGLAPDGATSGQELIDLLHSQVASLTSALESVTERCEALERAIKASPQVPAPSSQPGPSAALLSRVAALEAASAASTPHSLCPYCLGVSGSRY